HHTSSSGNHAPPARSALALHDALPIFPAGKVVQRRRTLHDTVTNGECRVVPRTTNRVANYNAILQRPAVVRAHCTNRTQSSVVADRKSTRLNSSHVKISYAVFCLKKKK